MPQLSIQMQVSIMTDAVAPALWLQPGTRLHMVVRRDAEPSTVDEYLWEIWTATDSRTGDSRQWRGTFLRLHPDGSIVQVHRDPHGVETELQVM